MRVRKNNSKPFNLNVAIAPEEAMNNKTEGSSREVVPEDKRAQLNVSCEPLQKMAPAEEAPRAAHTETLDHFSNFEGKRLKLHNGEASSTDRQNVLPNPPKRTTQADPQSMHPIRQQSSSSIPTTSKFAGPTSTTTGTQQQQQHQRQQEEQRQQQQQQQSNTDIHLSSPGMGPSSMPIENPANLQSTGSQRNVSYVQILQREMSRISADREKMRDEIERFQSLVGVLQSQIEQRRREIEALQSENEELRTENEALRRDSS